MREMIIRPGGSAGSHLAYAAGRFSADDDSFVISQLGGEAPVGGVLCSLGSDYMVRLSPDGSGCSSYGGIDTTSPLGLAKAWYLKDQDTGEVWSASFSPVCEKADAYEVSYLPGQSSFRTLKNKIHSTLTVAVSADGAYELWRVRLENRSAKERTLTFTTYVEPNAGRGCETKYVSQQRTLLVRQSLAAVGPEESAGGAGALLFHSSTLVPTRFQTERSEFTGESGTLRNPQYLLDDQLAGCDGPAGAAIASFTVEVGLPIEGEAEFGFCFGIASSPEQALEVARGAAKVSAINAAIDASLDSWRQLTSAVQVSTQDHAFDALVNTWLPYEAYAAWMGQRTGRVCLDPSQAADTLRRLHAFSAVAPGMCRENLVRFAAGISSSGTYSPDSESIVMLLPSELLWLAACTARYVAETGDPSILNENVTLRDGPSLSLKEHCGRAIRMCLAADAAGRRLLEQTARLWSFVDEQSKEFSACLQEISGGPAPGRIAGRRTSTRTEYPEKRNLPRRVKYFQSLSPSLSDSRTEGEIRASLGPDGFTEGEVATACCLYSALVEDVLGLEATYEGLTLRPNLPETWCECEMTRRFRGDTYQIHIRRAAAPGRKGVSIVVDGEPVLGDMLPYFADGREHRVDVVVS